MDGKASLGRGDPRGEVLPQANRSRRDGARDTAQQRERHLEHSPLPLAWAVGLHRPAMEVDQASAGSAKRLADASEAVSGPADSGSSSDKRQRQAVAARLLPVAAPP